MKSTRIIRDSSIGATRVPAGVTVRLPGDKDGLSATRLINGTPLNQPGGSVGHGFVFGKLPPGTVIADEYTVVKMSLRQQEQLKGGQADLYLADKNGTNYLIKLYRDDFIPNEKLLEKLLSLEGEALLRPVEYGYIDGRLYEIVPYAAGGTPSGRMTVKQLQNLAAAAADGLERLHQTNIVHRDIKPSNILYMDRQQKKPVLADYGISVMFDQPDQTVKMTAEHRSEGYAAPELYSGGVDREADFYSLGVTLLELATGINPFYGCSSSEIMRKTLSEKIAVPKTLEKNLARLIRGLLVKERKDRFGLNEIRKFAAGKKVPEPVVYHQKKSGTRLSGLRFHYPYQAGGSDDIYTLADAARWLVEFPDEGARALRNGTLIEWIKSNQDVDKGVSSVLKRVEELVESSADNRELLLLVSWTLSGKVVLFGEFTWPDDRSELIHLLKRKPVEFGKALISYFQ